MAADQRPLNEVVFLTVAEVATVMRVSKMTVYRLVHSGHLPAIRVGRSFRVPEQAVHDYLRESFVGWNQPDRSVADPRITSFARRRVGWPDVGSVGSDAPHRVIRSERG